MFPGARPNNSLAVMLAGTIFSKGNYLFPVGFFHVTIFCTAFPLSLLCFMKMLYSVVNNIYCLLSYFLVFYQKIKQKTVPQYKNMPKFYMLLNNCCVSSVSLLFATSYW